MLLMSVYGPKSGPKAKQGEVSGILSHLHSAAEIMAVSDAQWSCTIFGYSFCFNSFVQSDIQNSTD